MQKPIGTLRVMTRLIQVGSYKELAVVCQGSVPRICQWFAYNVKLIITIDKTEKSKIIFHSESGELFLVYH